MYKYFIAAIFLVTSFCVTSDSYAQDGQISWWGEEDQSSQQEERLVEEDLGNEWGMEEDWVEESEEDSQEPSDESEQSPMTPKATDADQPQ